MAHVVAIWVWRNHMDSLDHTFWMLDAGYRYPFPSVLYSLIRKLQKGSKPNVTILDVDNVEEKNVLFFA
jgi:hypothetical protein